MCLRLVTFLADHYFTCNRECWIVCFSEPPLTFLETGMVKKKYHNVSAVLVTFNRIELLKRCVTAVLSGSVSPDCLVIVDNGSSDGTSEELIREHGLIAENSFYDVEGEFAVFGNSSIKLIKTPRNIGGAGGFYHGTKFACENSGGIGFYWLMDDDGYPEKFALEALLGETSLGQISNSMVINETKPDQLAFGLEYNRHVLRTVDQVKKSTTGSVLLDSVNPFNGTLVGSEVVSKIGYPKRELFIWGDEEEYILRAKSNGISCLTVIKARHVHPASRVQLIKSKLFGFSVASQDADLKNYCDYRNRAHILWLYSKKRFFAHIARHVFVAIEMMDIKRLFFFLSASADGVFGNWGKERRYLMISKN